MEQGPHNFNMTTSNSPNQHCVSTLEKKKKMVLQNKDRLRLCQKEKKKSIYKKWFWTPGLSSPHAAKGRNINQ